MNRSFWFCIAFFQLFAISISAQESQHQISIRHDNDLYFLIDQYYTAGTFLRYDQTIKSTALESKQWHIQLSQELYTPSTKTQADSIFFDRPFAGILRLNTGIQSVQSQSAWFFDFDYALIGPQSKSDDVHQNFHKLIDEQRPVWNYQMPNKHHVNLSVENWQEFETTLPLFTKMRVENKVSLGTLDNYLQTGLNLDLNRNGSLNRSLSAGILNAKESFVLSTGFYYRYQIYDARIEGHLVNREAVFKRSIVDHIVMVKSSLKYQMDNIRLQLWYVQQTRKSIHVDKHRYLGIQVGFLF